MSLRNWLLHPPVGVGLAVVGLLTVVALNHPRQELARPPQAPVENSATDQNANAPDNAADQAAPIIETNPSQGLQETATADYAKGGQQSGQFDDWSWQSNASNVAIAFFTLVLTAVSIWQGIVTHKSLKVARRSTDASMISANAAVEANRLNQKSLAIARDATAQQLRPHVHIASAYVKNVKKPDERRVIVRIQNYGQTPAHQVRFRVCVHVHEWPPEREFDGFPDDLRQAVAPIAPSNYREMSVPVGPLSDWEEGELQADRAAIYCWGDVRYIAPGFMMERRTNFVLVCHGEGLKGGRLHPWNEGNDAN